MRSSLEEWVWEFWYVALAQFSQKLTLRDENVLTSALTSVVIINDPLSFYQAFF